MFGFIQKYAFQKIQWNSTISNKTRTFRVVTIADSCILKFPEATETMWPKNADDFCSPFSPALGFIATSCDQNSWSISTSPKKTNHTSPFRQYDPIWSNIIQCRLPGVYCGCVRVCYYMMFVVVMFVFCIALDWFTVGWVPAPDCVLQNFGLFLKSHSLS